MIAVVAITHLHLLHEWIRVLVGLNASMPFGFAYSFIMLHLCVLRTDICMYLGIVSFAISLQPRRYMIF